MVRRILIPLVVVGFALAQGGSGDPVSKYGLDLSVRKATEPEFTKDTRKFGIEIYQDAGSGNGLQLSELGSISVVPAKWFDVGDGKSKEPLWQHGLSLNVRPVGEKDWEKGKKISLEAYKDQTSGNLIYLNEKGNLGVVPAKFAKGTEKGKPKNPVWKHAMELRVRAAGAKDWDKAKRFTVEVFRDENNGNLIYVGDSGAFAVVPGSLASKEDTGKDPAFQHGLELAARRRGEREFSNDTKRYGIEVFLDENTGNLIYVTETGALAVVPGKYAKSTPANSSKAPEIKRGMDVQVRQAGQRKFDKDTPWFGIEVYSDENNGNLIYLIENGNLAVVPPKVD